MTVRSSNGNSAGLLGYVDHTYIANTGVKSVSITNSYFAGNVNSAYPVTNVKNPNATVAVKTTYYETGSYTGTAGGALGNAEEKETAAFLDGTVRDLLDQGVRVGGGLTNTGGLIGWVYPEVVVNSCWTEGTVIGGDYVGGLVGQIRLRNEGLFENCYSTMKVVTNRTTPNLAAGFVGGLVDEPPYSGTLKLRRCHFAGSVPTGKPIVGNKTERTILNVSSVYYREDSYTVPVNETLLYGALEKSVDAFKNGEVTELLNQAKKYGDFWNWKDGENGYPISDGIILVTDFKTYTDDSEFDNRTWADKFVNRDTGILVGSDDDDGNSGNVSDDDADNSQTGEKSFYIAVIAVLLVSAALVFLLARKKRNTN